jgi:hypothetical protein
MHWSNAGPIRAIFRKAFERAGIPYANPHSFRATLAGLGEKRCRSAEEFKAWSQNMGHEGVLTTFTSYGEVSRERQAVIIRSLTDQEAPGGDLPAIEKVLEAALAATRHFSRSDMRSTRDVAEVISGGENVLHPLMRQLHAVLSNGG